MNDCFDHMPALTPHQILGVVPKDLKPKIEWTVGYAFPRKTRQGRKYFKLKLTVLATAEGKPAYAKAWARKDDPDIFDIYAEHDALPVKCHSPFVRPYEGL